MGRAVAAILVGVVALVAPAGAAPAALVPPKGLYVTLREPDRPFEVGRWDGGSLLIGWNVLEPRRGAYDFSVIVARLGEARQAGKRLAIRLMAGAQSPSWVFDDVQIPKVSFTDPGANRGATHRIPAPWDRRMLGFYLEMITALGRAITPHAQSVAYLSVAGANDLWAEESWPLTQEDKDAWSGAGYETDAYVDTLVWLLDEHAARLPASLALGLHFGGAGKPDRFTVEPGRRLLEHAVRRYGARVVSRNNALQEDIEPGRGRTVRDKIAAIRGTFRSTIVLLYQFQPQRTGEYLKAAAVGADLGAALLEVPRRQLEANPDAWMAVRARLLQNGPR